MSKRARLKRKARRAYRAMLKQARLKLIKDRINIYANAKQNIEQYRELLGLDTTILDTVHPTTQWIMHIAEG